MLFLIFLFPFLLLAEAEQHGRDHNDVADFMQAAAKGVYGADGGRDTSLEETVGRRKAFSQRSL